MGQGGRVQKQAGSSDQGSCQIQCLDHARGITGSNHIGWYIMSDDRTCANDTIFAYRHPLTDNGTIADPYIVVESDRRGCANHSGSVIDIMPVCIGKVTPGSEHAIIANQDLGCRVNPDARADQAVIAHDNTTACFAHLPGGQGDFAIVGSDDMKISTYFNLRAMKANVPGFHQVMPSAKAGKLRRDELFGVVPLEPKVELFYLIGAVIVNHGMIRVDLLRS